MNTPAAQPEAGNTGITQTALDAAVASATANATAAGAKAATDRLFAILGDEKVKGREKAALDLAMKSPDMSAVDVVAFVAAHASPAAGTIDERMAGQGTSLALGGGLIHQPGAAAGSWDKAIAKLPGSKPAA